MGNADLPQKEGQVIIKKLVEDIAGRSEGARTWGSQDLQLRATYALRTVQESPVCEQRNSLFTHRGESTSIVPREISIYLSPAIPFISQDLEPPHQSLLHSSINLSSHDFCANPAWENSINQHTARVRTFLTTFNVTHQKELCLKTFQEGLLNPKREKCFSQIFLKIFLCY